MNASSAILLTAAFFGLSSCAAPSPPKALAAETPKKPAEGPQLVGRIASIPADKRFVLIQSYGKWNVEAGRILTTRGPDERTANLLTTGESLGEFAAADLQAGRVEVGDAVYSQHLPKPPPAPEPAQTPSDAPTGMILKNN